MITIYKWQQVKAMQRSGIGIKTIARELSLSKNTVKKYMRSDEPPRFKRPGRSSLCDAYHDEIADMLKKKFIGTRIFNELEAKGFTGSLSSVHRYLAGIKAVDHAQRCATTRIETAPGEQMQYDWKEWVLPIAGQPTKIYIHELILCYSRKKYYVASQRIRSADILRAIVEGIYHFGGAAKVLVIDNPKQLVIGRVSGAVRFTDEFLRICGTFGIEPYACYPYRAQTKGKVERPFFYLQEHLLRGLCVETFTELDRLLESFTATVNDRMHKTLKQSPNQLFVHEQKYLQKTTVKPERLFVRYPRKVTNDGYVHYEGNLYPVPMRLCLRDVLVEPVLSKHVRILDMAGSFICEHEIAHGKGVRPTHPEHEAINEKFADRRRSRSQAVVQRFADVFGDEVCVFVDGVKRTHGPNAVYHLLEVLSYADVYETLAVKQAILDCTAIGSHHKNSVARLLDSSRLKATPIVTAYPAVYAGVAIGRDLSDYRVEVTHAK